METKKWYQSKTIWLNAAALVAAAGAYMTGSADLGITISAVMSAVMNIVLRFTTKSAID